MFDPADELYTPYEEQLALAWAQAHLSDYMRTHPDCSLDDKRRVFLEAVDGGFSLALELRQ